MLFGRDCQPLISGIPTFENSSGVGQLVSCSPHPAPRRLQDWFKYRRVYVPAYCDVISTPTSFDINRPLCHVCDAQFDILVKRENANIRGERC